MAITNGYATLNEVKAAARITDSVDDSLLEMAIESSSRLIDGYCERSFYTSGTATRYFVPRSSYVCDVDDLAGTAITVAVSEAVDGNYNLTLDTATDLQLEPLNRSASGVAFPVTRLRMIGDYVFPYNELGEASVRVTGVYGFGTAVPMAVRQACVLMSLRQFKRYDSPLGVAGFGDMGALRVSRVDPDIQALLQPYRKNATGLA